MNNNQISPTTSSTQSQIKPHNSVYLAAISPYFTLGTVFDIEHAHLHHCLLEIQEEQGLVQCVRVHNVPCSGADIQCLVRCKEPVFGDQSIEVQVVEIIPCGIKGLLSFVASTACFGECLCKFWVQSWIRLCQPALERRTPCHSYCVSPCRIKISKR